WRKGCLIYRLRQMLRVVWTTAASIVYNNRFPIIGRVDVRAGESKSGLGETVVKLTLRDKETAQEAVRRFRKLVERSGIKKEMRVREFYEKPSETKRRARLRAQRRARRDRFMATH